MQLCFDRIEFQYKTSESLLITSMQALGQLSSIQKKSFRDYLMLCILWWRNSNLCNHSESNTIITIGNKV